MHCLFVMLLFIYIVVCYGTYSVLPVFCSTDCVFTLTALSSASPSPLPLPLPLGRRRLPLLVPRTPYDLLLLVLVWLAVVRIWICQTPFHFPLWLGARVQSVSSSLLQSFCFFGSLLFRYKTFTITILLLGLLFCLDAHRLFFFRG
jgi:hypothetical protein